MCLALAFAVPLIAMLAAMSLSGIDRPTAAQLRAKRMALLAVAAPTLFTFLGVVLYMLHDPVPDTWLWVACWAIALALLLRSDSGAPARVAVRLVPVPLRVAHGVSALALVMIFLALHIANHLMFPAGAETYDAVMKVFRHVYRTDILQPLVVALFLFQIGTGLFFAWRLTAAPTDRFRTFQIASGVYLAFYVLGHMDSVFIFARTYLGIDTGWGFATGAPTGLVKDPWNIRLVPHYWLGAFFVLAHLAAGARAVRKITATADQRQQCPISNLWGTRIGLMEVRRRRGVAIAEACDDSKHKEVYHVAKSSEHIRARDAPVHGWRLGRGGRPHVHRAR